MSLDQRPVLLVSAATLVGTVVLYTQVPKGFLPQQDTGVVLAVTEGAQSTSIPRLLDAQTEMAARVARDPAVAGVVSFVGAGTVNATPNAGRLTIALKPVRARDPVAAVIARLQHAVADIPGITAFFQPVQDIQIATRISRTQYQYSLEDPDPKELSYWATRLVEKLSGSHRLRDLASDQQNTGLQTRLAIDRNTASRLGISRRTR